MYYHNFYKNNTALIIDHKLSYYYEISCYYYNTRILYAQIGGFNDGVCDDAIDVDISTPEAKSTITTRRVKWAIYTTLEFLKNTSTIAYNYAKPYFEHTLMLYAKAKKKKCNTEAHDVYTPTLTNINIEIHYK